MENLKIRVNSEAESKEVQGLLEKLGFKKSVWGTYSDYFILANSNYYSRDDISNFSECDYKEITLPEFRDLVVLKRNNREDANVSEENCLYDLYLTESKELYFYHCGKNKWILSNLNGDDDYYESLKPMKEYLHKNSNGTYSYIGTVRPEHVSDFMIEIPEGATYYAKDASLGKNGNFFFRLRSDDFDFEAVWLESNWIQAIFNVENQDVLWQRHTHPEELPFIDDEPSLNDQYAEIEKVRQTLNQRQEQYGSFEDVAMITEQMVDVMRKGYYENLAYNQKMALYMICSKMARIVNGNPNHKDSWHDIAGYATLIDNELVSEKDMPF